jgi:hypothetical protein
VQLLARVRLDAISLPAMNTWMDEWMDGIQESVPCTFALIDVQLCPLLFYPFDFLFSTGLFEQCWWMANKTQAFRNGTVLLSRFLWAPQQQPTQGKMDRRVVFYTSQTHACMRVLY